jgi:predicted CopG family antitoxin
MDMTTIPISKETRDALKKVGRKDETYNDVINDLLEMRKEIDVDLLAQLMESFRDVKEGKVRKVR